MHNTGFEVIQVVYKALGCIEEGNVPHSDCVSFESIHRPKAGYRPPPPPGGILYTMIS